MLNHLALISVMILSLILFVNCVNSHKKDILTTLNRDNRKSNSVKKIMMREEEKIQKLITVTEPKQIKIGSELTQTKAAKKKSEYSNLNALEEAILEEVKKMKKD